MKKVLAVLLAVMMAFSVIAVCVSAEDAEPAGKVYTWPAGNNTLSMISKKDGKVVSLLQGGDVVQFEKITSNKATVDAPKAVEFIYYPDAATISSSISNVDWKENVIPKYDLDTKKWKIDTDKGDTVANHLAKSPSFYKTFVTSENFIKDDVPEITVIGLNAGTAIGKDSAGIVRGEGPIDYALGDTAFLGWAVYKVTWNKSNNSKATVELYALWERTPASDDDNPTEPENPSEPEKPTEPDTPEVTYDSPVKAALAKILAFFDKIRDYASIAGDGALGGVIYMFLDGTVRPWLYEKLGIEA